MKTILEYSTKNKYVSVLVGIAVTMLIQSSSATDVMVIGFVNSGLMNLFQAIGVIMGANIGTTITAQITAFHISAYAPAILFVGAILHLFVAKPFIKHVGSVIMGFGMLFEGVSLMKVAISPLALTPAFFPGILDLIRSLSPDNVGRQIANTHTIFAIVAVVSMLPFTEFIVKLTQRIIPVKPEETRVIEQRKLVYMNDLREVSPSKALNQAHKEISRMGSIALDNLRMAFYPFLINRQREMILWRKPRKPSIIWSRRFCLNWLNCEPLICNRGTCSGYPG